MSSPCFVIGPCIAFPPDALTIGTSPIYKLPEVSRLRKVKVRTKADAIVIGLPTYLRGPRRLWRTQRDGCACKLKGDDLRGPEIYRKARSALMLVGAAAYIALKFRLRDNKVAMTIVSEGNI